MRQRIWTGLAFTLAVALFVIPGYWVIWLPLALFLAIGIIIAFELAGAAQNCGLMPSLPLIISGCLASFLPVLFFLLQASGLAWATAAVAFSVTMYGLFVLLAVIILRFFLKRGSGSLPDALATGAALLYLAFPLACTALLITYLPSGWLWLIIGLASPWLSDVFAYFIGSLFGKRKIVPELSPKKTVEGFYGGLGGSMLAMMLIFCLFKNELQLTAARPAFYLPAAAASGLFFSLAAQLGDWLASGLKRYCKIKDFGKILPGHGGLMDRFDSAFFTLPLSLALAFIWQIIF